MLMVDASVPPPHISSISPRLPCHSALRHVRAVCDDKAIPLACRVRLYMLSLYMLFILDK